MKKKKEVSLDDFFGEWQKEIDIHFDKVIKKIHFIKTNYYRRRDLKRVNISKIDL